ncbi:MAG: hypothetical protein HY074_00090 [Deltaproteobacteria bacterium]|nr:hypothetical protein [Deltaproteobacteria bacterium]
MKKWNDLASLGLLDDVTDNAPPARAWEELTRTATKSPPAPKIIQPTVAKAIPRQAAKVPAERRVFSSTPTLRQMMHDYNRRTSTHSPIKALAPDESDYEFSFEKVDQFQFPNIPGKILRPSRSGDVDT